jgi:hypothetical protein
VIIESGKDISTTFALMPIHHSYFNYKDLKDQGKEGLQWGEPELTELWGESNLESAKEYKKLCQ